LTKVAFSLREKKADELDAVIAIPFRYIRASVSRLAYFSRSEKATLRDPFDITTLGDRDASCCFDTA
jgi:hypothetical protein